jgi:hypothetical protein
MTPLIQKIPKELITSGITSDWYVSTHPIVFIGDDVGAIDEERRVDVPGDGHSLPVLLGDGQLIRRDLAGVGGDMRTEIIESGGILAQVGVLDKEDAVGHIDASDEVRREAGGLRHVRRDLLLDFDVGVDFVESGHLSVRELPTPRYLSIR